MRFLSGLYNRQDWQGILDMEETALLTACAINLGTSGSVPDREASVYYWLGLAHERLAQQLSVEGVHVRQHHHTVHTRRLTDRYTETLAHLHTHTHTQRERERERERERDAHTHTHTHARTHTHEHARTRIHRRSHTHSHTLTHTHTHTHRKEPSSCTKSSSPLLESMGAVHRKPRHSATWATRIS